MGVVHGYTHYRVAFYPCMVQCCASADNSDCNVSVRPSVRHTPVLCQKEWSRKLSVKIDCYEKTTTYKKYF